MEPTGTSTRSPDEKRGEFLVALMNDPADFQILQEQRWYRIPKASAPKSWRSPQWLAFCQTKVFKEDAFAIHYWGTVRDIKEVKRHELFPDEFPNANSDKAYYQIHLDSLERLPQSIYSARARRLLFIPTTYEKFQHAVQINDLFADSPLEDLMWQELKRLKIDAERQWDVELKHKSYQLDFALFCDKGQVDIEVDGDTYHIGRERGSRDNLRNNALSAAGWEVLRYDTKTIRDSLTTYCIPQVMRTIKRLGGLSTKGIMPRTFYETPSGIAEQLTLFEERKDYDRGKT